MNQTNSQVQFTESDQYGCPIQYTPLLNLHPNNFFYCTPNNHCHYHVNCKEISYDTVVYLLNNKKQNIRSNENEYVFFYQQQHNNRFYQITCEIVSPSLITNCLNENLHGLEPRSNMAQEILILTSYQKENLEYHLTQYLSQYLLD